MNKLLKSKKNIPFEIQSAVKAYLTEDIKDADRDPDAQTISGRHSAYPEPKIHIPISNKLVKKVYLEKKKCKTCGLHMLTAEEKQTRSADEGGTIFYTCDNKECPMYMQKTRSVKHG